MKAALIYPYTRYIRKAVSKIRKHAVQDQKNILAGLIKRAQNTKFGKDHDFVSIKTYQDFKKAVPLADYEVGRPYYDLIREGHPNITWPDRPTYFAKTSGTTSGIKYIPITNESMPNHIGSARLALLNYASYKDHSKLFNGKVMFLSGSPILNMTNGIKTGRLSGIVNHEIPSWIKGNQLPTFETNCIEEWEDKVDRVIEETHNKDLRLISGIPPWVQMYFERLLDYTDLENIKQVFPNLQLFIYGGVNYEPYRASIESLIGSRIDSLETYPASEGFIAFQDTLDHAGLLLNTNSGIFYEFVKLQDIHSDNPPRVSLTEVDLNQDYVIIINSNAGLWGYNICLLYTSPSPRD